MPQRARVSIQVVICALLLLATAQTMLSYFHGNYSYLNLEAYAQGTEHNPFQRRVGMIPILRAAHQSPRMQSLAAKIRNKPGGKADTAFRSMTPEFLASMATGLAASVLLVGFMIWYGLRRFPQLWWLPASLVVLMLNVTLATRYETTIWYPYDLPHYLLFGVASLCVLEGWWPAAAALFLADMPMRETSLFLLPVLFAVAWARGQRRLAVLLPLLLLACWVPLQLYLHYRYLGNPSEGGIRLFDNLRELKNPTNWPQMASAFGYLLLPLLLGWRHLPRTGRAFLLGAAPALAITILGGVWTETRIFDEWIPAAAGLLTLEVLAWARQPAWAGYPDTKTPQQPLPTP